MNLKLYSRNPYKLKPFHRKDGKHVDVMRYLGCNKTLYNKLVDV